MKLFQCIACILVVFLLGCTNDEFSDPVVDTPVTGQDCFFTNDCLSLRISDHSRSSNHLVIDRTIEYFNNHHHEKNNLENKYGYPVWDAFYEELSSEIEDGLIPIINEDSELVEAVLYIKIDPDDDQLYFRTIDRKDIHKLLKKTDKEQKPKKEQDISRELAVGMFLHFDSFLFGHTECELIAYAPSGARRDQVSTRDEIVTCYYEYGYIVECYYYEIGGQIFSTDCTYTPYSETIFCFTSPGGTEGQNNDNTDPTNTTSDGSNQPGADPCEDADCPEEGEIINIEDDILDVSADLELIEAFMCLYHLFVNGNNSLFCNTIGPFYDPLDFTLKFDEIQNYGSAYVVDDGYTVKTGDNEITIYINKIHESPLHMASTILHEGIHAAIIAYFDNNGINVNLLNEEDLLSQYAETTNANLADHYYMVNNYIIPLAEALQEIDNNRLGLEYYFSFAWDGLDQYAINPSDIAHKNQYFGNSVNLDALNASGLCK